jgi:pimeloyl-ACP methyl ester carboxylesterase
MISPQQWYAQTQGFDFNGHRIVYRDQGQGEEALLLIHGFPTCSWDYAALWPRLDSRFARLVAPDMLGFGRSDKPAGHAYSMIEQTDLHLALLAELGVTRIHILAHDYGVSLAQELLARELEGCAPRILSVALLNGGLFPETHRLTRMQRLLRSPLGGLVSRLSSFRSFSRSFSLVFGPQTRPSESELRAFWELICHQQGHHRLHELIRYIDDRRAHRARWVGALQRTRVRVRLINGPEDPVSGAHMVARYRELIPNPDIVSLPGIGHYPQVEDPDGVWAALQGLWET